VPYVKINVIQDIMLVRITLAHNAIKLALHVQEVKFHSVEDAMMDSYFQALLARLDASLENTYRIVNALLAMLVVHNALVLELAQFVHRVTLTMKVLV
jgi:hypothetical protein